MILVVRLGHQEKKLVWSPGVSEYKLKANGFQEAVVLKVYSSVEDSTSKILGGDLLIY